MLRNINRISALVGFAAAALLAPPLAERGAAQSFAPPEPVTGSAAVNSNVTTPTHAVFLHAGPNGAAPIIGTLRPGMPVEVLASVSPGWLQVRSAAGEGWAWSSYFPGGAHFLSDGTSAVAGPANVFPGGAPESGRRPTSEITSP